MSAMAPVPKPVPLDEIIELDPDEVGIPEWEPIQWKPWRVTREWLKARLSRRRRDA